MSGQREPILVVGAGLTGLSAALLAARAGYQVEVWEGRDRPGGLVGSIRFRGLDCDAGSHRVHPAAHPLLQSLTAKQGWRARPRRGRLLLGGRQIAYPPNPVGFLSGLGLAASLQLGLGLLLRPGALRRLVCWERERAVLNGNDPGYEEFVRQRVGGGAYGLFYRPYIEKVFGEAPHRLSQSVAKQRVSTTSPLHAIFKRGHSPQFLYPKHGMAGIIAELQSRVRELGVDIHYGRRANAASLAATKNRRVLFTGYLQDLLSDCGLHHRGLYLLHLAFPAHLVPEQDTWYAPEKRFWFGRVSRLDQFSTELLREGEATLCVEIPEGRWGPKVDFLARLDRVVAQLVDAQILEQPTTPLDAKQSFLPRVYPIYLRGWHQRFWAALDQLAHQMPHLLPIGRQGLFLHCNMDHCVQIASDAVEHLGLGAPAYRWKEQVHRYLGFRVRD